MGAHFNRSERALGQGPARRIPLERFADFEERKPFLRQPAHLENPIKMRFAIDCASLFARGARHQAELDLVADRPARYACALRKFLQPPAAAGFGFVFR